MTLSANNSIELKSISKNIVNVTDLLSDSSNEILHIKGSMQCIDRWKQIAMIYLVNGVPYDLKEFYFDVIFGQPCNTYDIRICNIFQSDHRGDAFMMY